MEFKFRLVKCHVNNSPGIGLLVMVGLVTQSGAVDGEVLLAGQDVHVRVVPVLYPVIRPGPGVQLARHTVLPHAIEQRHQGAPGDVSLGEQALARISTAVKEIKNGFVQLLHQPDP